MATAPKNEMVSAPTAKANSLPHNNQLCVAVLGEESYGLVKLGERGAVQAINTKFKLNEDRGEVYRVSGKIKDANSEDKWVQKPVITAAGYFRMNQVGGVSFATPETILGEDGKLKGNPYAFPDAADEKKWVKVRRIGIGMNAVGALVAIDLTVTYSLVTYFAQDIWAKWKPRSGDPKKWAELYAGDAVPEEVRTNPKRKIVSCPGGVVLALDLMNNEVLGLLQDNINRHKFAERNAITICERNILKKFFAASLIDNSLFVQVISWQRGREQFDIMHAVERISAGEKVDNVIDGEVITESIEPSKDEVDQALHGDADEDQVFTAEEHEQEEEQEEEQQQVEASPEQLAAVRSAIREVYGKLPKPVSDETLKSAGIASLKDLATCESLSALEQCLDAINKVAYERQQQQTKKKQETLPLDGGNHAKLLREKLKSAGGKEAIEALRLEYVSTAENDAQAQVTNLLCNERLSELGLV